MVKHYSQEYIEEKIYHYTRFIISKSKKKKLLQFKDFVLYKEREQKNFLYQGESCFWLNQIYSHITKNNINDIIGKFLENKEEAFLLNSKDYYFIAIAPYISDTQAMIDRIIEDYEKQERKNYYYKFNKKVKLCINGFVVKEYIYDGKLPNIIQMPFLVNNKVFTLEFIKYNKFEYQLRDIELDGNLYKVGELEIQES